MIVLSATTDKIQVVLGGAVTANQMHCVASWRDITTADYTPGRSVANTNDTTDVDLIAAPGASTQRVIDHISVYNNDTAVGTLSVKYDANGTDYVLFKATIPIGGMVQYSDATGWVVTDATGKILSGGSLVGVTSGGTITTVALGSDAASNSTTTGVEITGLRLTLTAGTYVFQYYIRYQSAATTTGVSFGVNYTGTATAFAAQFQYLSTGTTASTGAASQVASGATGQILEALGARTRSTTAPNLGATVSVDAINADMLAVVEGFMVVTDGGDLAFWHASEVAAASTVMAGSSLILFKVA